MLENQGLLLLRHALVLLAQPRPSGRARRKVAAAILQYLSGQGPLPSSTMCRCSDLPSKAERAYACDRQTSTSRTSAQRRPDSHNLLPDYRAGAHDDAHLPLWPCRLSHAGQLVLKLSGGYGLDGAAIAFLLGMSRRAVKQHLRDAVAAAARAQACPVTPASRRGTDL